MVFVREDNPVWYVSTKDKRIAAFFFELNLLKRNGS